MGIDDYHPTVIVCGSHHAVHLASIELDHRYEKLDLSSVTIIAPMGAAVPSNIVNDLQRIFPSMMKVKLVVYQIPHQNTTI